MTDQKFSSNPKISILVPCFNVEKYVQECVNSLLNQTIKDIEIICINDGSTDATPSLLEEFTKQDIRIRVINKKNSGYGDSMNKGLELASGEYLGIVESDDFVESNMFQELYDNAVKYNLDISRCCYYERKGAKDTPVLNDWVPKNSVHNPNVNTAAFWQAPAIWCSIYRREWLERNQIRFLPTPGASYQDTSFAFKCYASCERFYMSDKPLLHYRIDNQNSSVNNKSKVFCVCEEWDEIYRFVRSDKKRFGHLLSLMPILQYGTYKWNLDRLDNKYRKAFLSKWIKEIIGHFVRGEMPITHLDPVAKSKIKKLFASYFSMMSGKE